MIKSKYDKFTDTLINEAEKTWTHPYNPWPKKALKDLTELDRINHTNWSNQYAGLWRAHVEETAEKLAPIERLLGNTDYADFLTKVAGHEKTFGFSAQTASL